MKMKVAGLFLVLLAIAVSVKAETIQNCAAIYVNFTLFNLCPFAQNPPYQVHNTFNLDTVSFTLGNNHISNCANTSDIWATTTDSLTEACDDVAIDAPSYSLIDSADPNQGLVITFDRLNNTNGTLTPDYQLVVTLICSEADINVNETTFTTTSFSEIDGLTIISLTASSNYGCPAVSINKFLDYLKDAEDVLAGILGVTGLILCFFGLTLFNFAIFVVSALVTIGLIITICFQFVDLTTAEWALGAVWGGSAVLGVIVGIYALKYKKVGYGIIGAVLGDIAGYMVYESVIAPVVSSEVATYIFYGILMVAGAVGSNLALCMIDKVAVIATSVIGAFLAVRSASVFISGEALETFAVDGVKNYDFATFGYLAVIVLLLAWGMYFQFRNKKKKAELGAHDMDRKILNDVSDMRC